MMTSRDLAIYRTEFWAMKRLDGLRTALKDARAAGDPIAVYQLKDELAEFVANRRPTKFF